MSSTIRVWSILSESAWQCLQQTGRLTADERYVDSDLIPSYLWMIEQMKRKVGEPPANVRFPLWAWAQCESAQRPKPDLRKTGHTTRGTNAVRIEAMLPSELVLLSDFDLWHHVLNNSYLPTSLEDMNRRFASEDTATDAEQAAMEEEKRLSWQRIFDLDWVDPDINVARHSKSIQGVFWELSLAQVVRFTPFVAR